MLVNGVPAGSRQSLANVGMLIEDPGLYPYLSGRDNLRVFARYAGVPAVRVEQVLERCGADLAATTGRRVTLGMKQRARRWPSCEDPAPLILDEPTNGLYPAGVADMRRCALSHAGVGILQSDVPLPKVFNLPHPFLRK